MTIKAFTSGSGSWTVPSGVKAVKVTMIGAGGGGGGSAKGSDQWYEGGGGGGGACTQFTMEVSSGSSYSYTIGTGGSGGNGKTVPVQGGGIVGDSGGNGGATTFGSYYVNGGKPGTGAIVYGSTKSNGKGGDGGSGGKSAGTIYSGGAGGAGGKDGSGYGHGDSILNAGGGGGGIGDSAIYNYATNAGYSPHTDSSANASAQEGGKPGHYGTGGGGDSGADSSGNYGIGGKGGDGLIILEYYVIEEYTVTINATNGTISTSENGTYTQSLSLKVPKTGVSYGVSSNNQMYFMYKNTPLYIIYAKPNKGYDVPSWSPSSGDVTSSMSMSVSFSKKLFFCMIYPGQNYKSYRIIQPSRYNDGINYNYNQAIDHYGGETIDVDWEGATVETEVNNYHKKKTVYAGTNIEKLVYGSTVITSGDGKTLPSDTSEVYPYPESARVSSETNYYRCQVSFSANGGSGVPSPKVSEWTTSETSIYVSWDDVKPIRNGWAFLGWAKSSSATSAEFTGTSAYLPKGATTLYAVWSQTPQRWVSTLKYNANGGSNAPSNNTDEKQSLTQPSPRTVAVSSVIPIREGHTFLGWSLSSGASTVQYQAGSSISVQYSLNGTSSTTLYAVWQKNNYTITVLASSQDGEEDVGGSVAGGGTFAYGTSITISATPDNDHEFIKWSDGSTSSSRTITVKSNATFTAVFARQKYKVIFHANNGTSETKEQTLRRGISERLMFNTFSKVSYSFLGWAESEGSTTVKYVDGEMVLNLTNTSIHLYAVWEQVVPQNPGVIQFKRWDGSSAEVFSYSDMARIQTACETLMGCVSMTYEEFVKPSAGDPLDYREMNKIETCASRLSALRGLSLDTFVGWYAGYSMSYIDIERVESNLYAIYADFGGTTPRMDA